MGEIIGERVVAGQADLRRHTGERRTIGGHGGKSFPAEPVGNGDRHRGPRAAGFELFAHPLLILLAQANEPFELCEHLVQLLRVFAADHYAESLFIARQKTAVAVVDQPARGGQKLYMDAVIIGLEPELVGLLDLHIAHTQAKRAHKGELGGAKNQGTPRYFARRLRDFCRGTSHRAYLISSASAAVIFSIPSTTEETRTASG